MAKENHSQYLVLFFNWHVMFQLYKQLVLHKVNGLKIIFSGHSSSAVAIIHDWISSLALNGFPYTANKEATWKFTGIATSFSAFFLMKKDYCTDKLSFKFFCLSEHSFPVSWEQCDEKLVMSAWCWILLALRKFLCFCYLIQ
jgi:hypothetical protein